MTQTALTPDHEPEALADDLLEGAGAIAEFMFGDAKLRKKVYYLRQSSRLPLFHIGTRLCARKSTLLRWIRAQEESRLSSMSRRIGGSLTKVENTAQKPGGRL